MSKKQIGILTAIIAIVAITGILYINGLKPPEKPRTFMSLSWYRDFNSTKDLTDYCQLIIVGEVSGIRQVFQTSHETLFEIKVLEVIKKPEWFSNTTITELQFGAETDDYIYEVKLDPLMHVGEKYVLFLYQSLNYTGTEQWANLGPWTRYMIKEGKVYSLDIIYPDRFDNFLRSTRVSGIQLSDFKTTVSTLMRETE